MLELINRSNWQGGIYPGWDKSRKYQLTVVFKATYSFNAAGKLTLLDTQPAIEQIDQYQNGPLSSSIKIAHEIAPFKYKSELYLYGTAYPASGSVNIMEVGVGLLFKNGVEWKKILRIFGQRHWQKNILNYILSKPTLITEPVPLIYENAFGGTHPGDEATLCEFNPVGKGFNPHTQKLITTELPQIEVGPDFMTNPAQNPTPAGFSPIAPNWEPRLTNSAEIMEDVDARGGCPYSDKATPSLHNVAPADQQFNQFFTGGEVLHLRALLKEVAHDETTQIVLPELNYQLYSILDNDATLIEPVCDTLIVNTDERTLTMIYRAGIPWQRLDRRQGWVVLKDLDKVNRSDVASNPAQRIADAID